MGPSPRRADRQTERFTTAVTVSMVIRDNRPSHVLEIVLLYGP